MLPGGRRGGGGGKKPAPAVMRTTMMSSFYPLENKDEAGLRERKGVARDHADREKEKKKGEDDVAPILSGGRKRGNISP